MEVPKDLPYLPAHIGLVQSEDWAPLGEELERFMMSHSKVIYNGFGTDVDMLIERVKCIIQDFWLSWPHRWRNLDNERYGLRPLPHNFTRKPLANSLEKSWRSLTMTRYLQRILSATPDSIKLLLEALSSTSN